MDVAPTLAENEAQIPDLIRSDPGRRSLFLRILIGILAVAAIVLGFIGWVLPVVPGLPLLLLGLGLLGFCSRKAARVINSGEARLPRKWRRRIRRLPPEKPAEAVPSELLQRLLQAHDVDRETLARITQPGNEESPAQLDTGRRER
jgi:hypothetical protein